MAEAAYDASIRVHGTASAETQRFHLQCAGLEFVLGHLAVAEALAQETVAALRGIQGVSGKDVLEAQVVLTLIQSTRGRGDVAEEQAKRTLDALL